jgi:uncharacterized protein (DUF2249 family)
MTINANTKISALLKQHPDALEAIVSISPKFIKLRNPFLRKLMAGRTTIAMASRLGGCSVNDFFSRLQPLGFEIDSETKEISTEKNSAPDFLRNIGQKNIIDLDVRPVIQSGKDPLTDILQKVKQLQPGQVLRIINTFEPTPLMHLLGKQGFESYAETIKPELIHTYFYKKNADPIGLKTEAVANSNDWDELLDRFKDKLVTIDVRHLEMPLPMHTILEALNSLPAGKALFVYHKRIPVFLLPELEERKFSFRIKEINATEVHLLIYKD